VGILRTFATFIGWLAGALAGVSAIFYAIGYLITRSHLTLLGIYGLFDEGNVQLITKGAMFTLSIASFAGAVLLPLSALFGVGALFVWLVILILRYCGLTEFIQTQTEPFIKWAQKPSFNVVLYVALLLLLVRHYDLYSESFQSPLLISNVLYNSNDGRHTELSDDGNSKVSSSRQSAATRFHDPDSADIDNIRQWLEKGNTKGAHDHFRMLLWGEVFAGLLLAAAWHVTIEWQQRALWLSYFAINFAAYTVSLPMIYGVLVDPIEYPVITLDSSDQSLTHAVGKLFLLNKTDQEFVLWDSHDKRILWIPKSEVKWAAVQQTENIFAP
jgi:hypothetical protein